MTMVGNMQIEAYILEHGAWGKVDGPDKMVEIKERLRADMRVHKKLVSSDSPPKVTVRSKKSATVGYGF